MKSIAMASAALGATLVGLAVAVTWLFDTDASDTNIALGRTLYAQHCASCHGVNLEGQPDWKSQLPTGRMPAPPHDASGHTWHHPDGVLFRIVKESPSAVVGGGYESDMPPFDEIMGDEEIRDILAFIKSMWPDRERTYQAEMSRREKDRAQ